MKLVDILNEAVVDKELQQEFDQLGELSDEITKLNKKLSALKKSRDPLLVKFTDILEGTEDEVLQSEKYAMAIKKRGFERSSPSYKTAFTEALKKVNAQTKKVLNEVLYEATSIAKIATSINMIKKEPMEEGWDVKGAIKKLAKKVLGWKKMLTKQKSMTKELERLYKNPMLGNV